MVMGVVGRVHEEETMGEMAATRSWSSVPGSCGGSSRKGGDGNVVHGQKRREVVVVEEEEEEEEEAEEEEAIRCSRESFLPGCGDNRRRRKGEVMGFPYSSNGSAPR